MRDTYAEILFNVTGQSLVFDVPEGRPSSVVSVTVYRSEGDDTGQTETAVSTPVIESVSTTISADAGPTLATDVTALTLAATTGVAKDRTYLLTAATGDYEFVEVASLNTTTKVVNTRVPLMNDYESGSTFVSTRITAPLISAWVQNSANLTGEGSLWNSEEPGDFDEDPWWRAAVVYVVNGITYKREIRFDVVRYSSQHTITPLDVDNAFPGWLDRVGRDYRKDQGRRLIDEAFRSVRFDLLADAKTARWIRRQDVIGELVVCKANLKEIETAVMRGAATLEALQAAKDVYTERYAQLIREPHVKIGASSGGAIVATQPRTNLWRR